MTEGTRRCLALCNVSYKQPVETTNHPKSDDEDMEERDLMAMMQEHHQASWGWARACGARWGVEAEDVLQSVYVKVLSGQAAYRGSAAFKTWLFAVIRNTALDERRRRRLRWLLPFSDEGEADARPDRTADPGGQVEQSQAAESFRKAIARLPGRQQEVMHLVFYQDLSIQEAAEIMGVSLGSARTHYERGKQRLREWLSEGEEHHGRG